MRRSLSYFHSLFIASGALGLVAALASPASARPACGEGQTNDVKIEIGVLEEGGDPADPTDFDPFNREEIVEFFNTANCFCETEVALRLSLQPGIFNDLDSDPVELYFGSDCTDEQDSERTECVALTDIDGTPHVINDVTTLRGQTVVLVNAAQLMTLAETGRLGLASDECSRGFETSREIYARVDATGSDADFNKYLCTLSISLPEDQSLFVDTRPPAAPEGVNAEAGEDGVLIKWTNTLENQDDLEAFQVLCQRADGSTSPDDNFPRADPAFQSTGTECPGVFARPAGELPDAGPDIDAGGGGSTPPADIDPNEVCSPELSPTAESFRVNGLENGVAYTFRLAAVDLAGNTTVVDAGTETPRAVTDFWEDYQSDGGTAQGGYCFVATAAYGDYDHPYVRVLRDFRDESLASTAAGRWAIQTYYDTSPPLAGFIERHESARFITRVVLFPVVVGAGMWVYSGALGKLAMFAALALLVCWRRMRRQQRRAHAPDRSRRLGRAAVVAGTATLVLLAWQGLASAQPYWDEVGGPASKQTVKDEYHPQWNFSFMLGPYIPAIDDSVDVPAGQQGPFEEMFGDNEFITQLELDRFFLYPYGQFGVGAGLGWFSADAKAFEVDSAGMPVFTDSGKRKRSESDDTSLRILPTWVVAVYRFTWLDDRAGVPIIPYAKAGLSYYFWWVTRPDGDDAFVLEDPMCVDEPCQRNTARGGSFGYQGTVGIAIRAERIDPRAAASLRNELGVEHMGIFAELTSAQVDSFGAEDRLPVGDTTWLAGINFEF